MRNHVLTRILILTLAVLLVGASGQAQTAVDHTTFSAAVSATATRVTVSAASGAASGGYLFVEGELMAVQTVSGTTLTVRRGVAGGGAATQHGVDAIVWVGAGEEFDSFNVAGPCTASSELYVPHINTAENRIFDCASAGYWAERDADRVNIQYASTVCGGALRCRDEFNNGYLIMQDDGTAQSVTDDEDNFVYGSPLGAIEYREELGKTTSSWVTVDGVLDISADDTTNDEGVEIVFGTGEGTLQQVLEAGTHGACIAAMVTVADISGTDQVQIGWRQNEAFTDSAAYAGYTVWNSVGINATDGSIVSSQEVSEATDTDDSGINWADTERRALKVCVSSGGVPTAYYSDASPDNEEPVYQAIAMTETGSTLTAGTGLVPFLSYLAAGTDGADVTVQWVELTYTP